MDNDFFKLIFVALLVGTVSVFGTVLYCKKSGTKISQVGVMNAQEATQKAIEFINKNLLQGENKASLINDSVEEQSGLYKFRIKIQEQEYTSFVTKDGKILFPEEGIDLNKTIAQPATSTPAAPKTLEKRERPDVKLFVMTYCPYGLQMQKAILPVWQLLEKKADIGVYFVAYLMHGKEEMDENLRQYCIQKEQKEKYLDYLACFTVSGKTTECQQKSAINQDKLKACVEQTDKEFKISEQFTEKGFPPFNIHSELNKKYGVQGSPTLIINDVEVSPSSRSPEAVKQKICEAFLTPPPECQQKLSEETASAGFGTGTGSGGGSCQ